MADTPHKEEQDSPLIAHAKRELALAGIDKADSDYGGALATAALDLIRTFAGQRHSGASAEMVKQIFLQLASFEVLTPLTNSPEEWRSVSKEMGEPMWQNVRGPAYLSRDGGKTWFRADNAKVTGKSITPAELDAKKADS